MAGNLGKEDSSSVQDLQDPSITGSGHKRRRGSVQQASSRAGKKPKRDIDRDHREKKKQEVETLKAETEEHKKSKFHLEGQAFILEKHLKETREENTKLKIELERQSDSIHKLEKLIDLGEHRQKYIHALEEKLEQKILELNALKEETAQKILEANALKEQGMPLSPSWLGTDIEGWFEKSGEMNNPMETPATAEPEAASTGFGLT